MTISTRPYHGCMLRAGDEGGVHRDRRGEDAVGVRAPTSSWADSRSPYRPRQMNMVAGMTMYPSSSVKAKGKENTKMNTSSHLIGVWGQSRGHVAGGGGEGSR